MVMQSVFVRGRSLMMIHAIAVVPMLAASTGSAAAQTATAKRSTAGGAPTLAAQLREDDDFYQRRLLNQRAQYLRGASWANLGERCNPGSLRIFPGATSREERDSLERIVLRMEQTILGRGAGATAIDTPDGRALLRTIVGWEAGIDRPNWDSDEKRVRQAISTGLTGEYPDPNGPGCLTAITNDTVTFVLPGFTDMIFPNSPNVRVKAYFGPEAINHARNEFAAKHLNTPGAELSYIFISPFVMWRDWAVVTVTRPVEERGVVVGKRNDGGAVYLMHRVGTEWRLLSIMRTWGS